jgi:hypothetical protein
MKRVGEAAKSHNRIKYSHRAAENEGMKTLDRFRITSAALLSLVVVTATAQAALPRGTDIFSLGMTRGQVDSVLATRGVELVNDQPSLVACVSDQPGVEYEQYLFFQNGVGSPSMLWRVTLLYDEKATPEVFDAAAQELTRRLGTSAETPVELDPERPVGTLRKLTWVDDAVAVQLGARFPEGPVTSADRMKQTWTDRRLQKNLAARLKRDRERSGHGGGN